MSGELGSCKHGPQSRPSRRVTSKSLYTVEQMSPTLLRHAIGLLGSESTRPFYTESSDSFVSSAAASIATGWNEPVPGRELHPLKSSAFHGALLRQLTLHSSRRTFRMLGSAHRISSTTLASGSSPVIFPLPSNRSKMERRFSTMMCTDESVNKPPEVGSWPVFRKRVADRAHFRIQASFSGLIQVVETTRMCASSAKIIL